METIKEDRSSWLDKPIFQNIVWNPELILWIVILILAFFSRFYILGARVMSHDENTHVYYSWRFWKGQGFAHDPLMHGPLQFHLIALTYFMFGDNDFTARTPAALFSIATVAFMWYYRRYLGRAGTLVAAFLMLASPYMLYYGRYARNEAFVGFFGVATIYAMLRYLESGQARYLYLLTTVTILHFTAKETAFIYTAQALLFLAFYLIHRLINVKWKMENYKRPFLIALILGLTFLGAVGVYTLVTRPGAALNPAETVAPSIPGTELEHLPMGRLPGVIILLSLASLIGFCAAIYIVMRGYTWEALRAERSFGMLILLGTLVLPQLSAFPVRFLGWTIPTNAGQVEAMQWIEMLRMGIILLIMFLASIVVGLMWQPRLWLINAAIFYGLFIIFYTSLFTNGAGFFTGLVGSLGYWLEQQGVNRGSQPWYYYGLVQMPVYEFLPVIGTWLAFGIVLVRRFITRHEEDDKDKKQAQKSTEEAPVFPLLGFWAVTSLVAFSIAGEKMPWLTVHITLPAILCAAWGIGILIDGTDWSIFRQHRGWLLGALLPVFLVSLLSTLSSLLGTNPPFQGKTLEQLQATSTFLTSFLAALASGIGIAYVMKSWQITHFLRLFGLLFFGLLGILTVRSSFLANYINYDNANELLVYAHSAGGVKIALAQIEEISKRTTDGLALTVAYDNETSYPYWWYLRNYPNQRYYGSDPTRSLRDVPVILVGDANYGKIEAIVGQAYHRFDYIRLWWPNQDYFGLTWERIWNAIRDPAMREAIFYIWLDRDYSRYGRLTNRDMSLPNWSPAARMRLYIRKDVISQIWNYGVMPSPEEVVADPFEGKLLPLTADQILGSMGSEAGQFMKPRDMAIAKDGSLYIADTDNHRIQHLAVDGTVLHVWGSYGDLASGSAPGGTFNQPWGIGIGLDGSVYVADTWNHRIQKFTPEGEFLTMWGYFGQGEKPEAFWGPRDIAVDAEGRVYVTDTGNKRVVVFTPDGEYIAQFGSAGLMLGQMDEPVGITIDTSGRIYIADTWNQRIQVFARNEAGMYESVRAWDLVAWFGQSLDNKPYLAVDNQGRVYAADPEGYRVLVFTTNGEVVGYWGDYGVDANQFGMPASVAIDAQGGIWVVDAGNGRIMHFPPLAK